MRMCARVLAFACTIALFAGCSNDASRVVHLSSDTIDAPQERSSPENVLENVALAHRLQDIELYKAQLAPTFALSFREVDLGEQGTRTGLSYDGDILSTTNLFETSEWIRYEMVYETPAPSTQPEFPAADGFREVRVHHINITIKPEFMEGPLVANNEESVYVFEVDPDSLGLWRIAHQWITTPPDRDDHDL